jgi:adenosine kinase
LGAAQSYNKSHYESAEIQKAVVKATHYYAEGFFLSVSPETLFAMATHSVKNNKVSHFFLENFL